MGSQYINIVSWNINGCSTPTKRKKILTYLKSKNTDIALIQETHFKKEEEALKMKRDWVGKVFHNSVSSKSCGVAILVNKKLNFIFSKEFKDSDGRILCVEAKINGVKVILCNIYAPNKESPNFVSKVSKMLGGLDGPLILGGDFNQVIDDHLDRSKIRPSLYSKERNAIHSLQEDLSLIDIWRLVNPREREYSFYSHSHKTYSRIDFFLISHSLVDKVIDCNIGVIAITDHALVELHLDLNVDKIKVGRWRMNTSLLQDEEFAKKLGEDICKFLELNIGSTARLATVWDALKAFVRGKFISQSSFKKKESRNKLQLLEKEIIDLEKLLAERFAEEKFRKIYQLKYDLHEIYNKKTEYALFRLKTNFYENGEKTGRLLARQLKSQDANNTIMTIRENNELITSTTGINKIFKSFYEELYTSSNITKEDDLAIFF